MALRDTWIDKVDGVDDASADDINTLAHAVIELEEELEENGGGGSSIVVDSEMSDESANPVQNKVIKAYVDESIGLALEEDY